MNRIKVFRKKSVKVCEVGMGGLVDKRSLHTKLIYTVKASSIYFLWFTKNCFLFKIRQAY